ncbi:MAG: alpha/beta hydrolase fold domain-containing protein [Bacteroidota bacterium]
MKITSIILSAISIITLYPLSHLNAQFCTSNHRFTEVEYFNSAQIDSSMEVVYAIYNGNEELAMDIYYPDSTIDNLSKRPFIMLFHGGGYIAGNRRLMRNTCFEFAKRGFVTATVSHRFGTGPGINLDAIYRAEQDAHAAVRYLVQHADSYGIDTAWIFTGGESSGANISLAMPYTDQGDWDFINAALSATYGGLYTSGNDLTNTYSIKGVLNNWGSLLAPSFDSLRNVAIISFHGEQDPIIDIDLDSSIFRGGSRWIYQATTNFGHCNSLTVDSLGSHGVYQGLDGLNFRVTKASCFFKSVFCEGCTSISTFDPIPPSCSIKTSVYEKTSNRELSVFPNPFFDNIQIAGLTGNESFVLFNMLGHRISSGGISSALSLDHLAPGIYFLNIYSEEYAQTIKLIKN